MSRLNLRLVHRPVDPDALPDRLVEILRAALARGGAPPAAVVVRGERMDIAVLQPVVDAGLRVPVFVAALSRSTMDGVDAPVAAVGLIGIFRGDPAISGGPDVPVATVFLEWADGRWAHWRALLDPETRAIREDTVTTGAAEDGDPLPERMGRWWSLGRRRRMSMHLSPTPVIVRDLPGSDLVH